WEPRRRPLRFGPGERVRVPCAVAVFPKEIVMPPRSWVERVYNVQRWSKMPRGGHFAAFEQPALPAQDIREFFPTLLTRPRARAFRSRCPPHGKRLTYAKKQKSNS